MNIRGRIHEIFDTVNVSESFKKREFVIEYKENPQYPEYLKFELIQDRCDMMDQYKIGTEVEVYFNLKGREWTNKQGEKVYFNSLQAWKIEQADGAPPAPQYEIPPEGDFDVKGGEDDVLPF